MPSKNTVKIYINDSYYHIYNRGVAKQKIFYDSQDYKVFINYLKDALSEPPKKGNKKVSFTLKGRTFKGIPRTSINFNKKIILIAYCLMPNHFHLLIKQSDKNMITHFMRSIITRYSIYFNKKYDRVGPLFQGRYKAALINNDDYLLHLTRYIHLNPSEINVDLEKAYSSYEEFLDIRKTNWIKPDIVLGIFNKKLSPEFKKINTYKKFVEDYAKDARRILGKLTLD